MWEGLARLVARYMDRSQGYAARRAVFDLRSPMPVDEIGRAHV